MSIQVKRVYAPQSPRDGQRILVDRLWPRGLSKASLKLDAWLKELSPSNELRKWYHQDKTRWSEFQKRYVKELQSHLDLVEDLRRRSRRGRVTLLYSATDETHNNAVALKDYLES